MKFKKNIRNILLLFIASFIAYYLGADFQYNIKYNWIHKTGVYLGYALLFLSVFASVTTTLEIAKSDEVKPKMLWILLAGIPILFCFVIFILSLVAFDLKLF